MFSKQLIKLSKESRDPELIKWHRRFMMVGFLTGLLIGSESLFLEQRPELQFHEIFYSLGTVFAVIVIFSWFKCMVLMSSQKGQEVDRFA